MQLSLLHIKHKSLTIRLLCFAVILFLSSTTYKSNGQANAFRAGAREAALANTGVALGGNWSMFHNPAGLASVSDPNLGVHYTNQFLLQELSISSLAGVLPISYGGFGITASYFGTKSYNEQKYAFGYAHKLGEIVNAGISLDYFRANLPEDYEPSGALAGEIGLLVNPIENLNIGCHLYNVTGSKYKDYEAENLPSFFTLGAAWKADVFLVTSQVNLDKNNNTTISAGSEVLLIPVLAVRFGVSTDDQFRYSFGLGYKKNKFSGDIAFTQHPVLGLSSFVSFNYSFERKSK